MNFINRGIHSSICNLNVWSRLLTVQIRCLTGFSKHTDQDVDYFKNLLGPNGVKQEDLDGYNKDWLRSVEGNSKLALFPKTNSEISSILNYCNKRLIPVVVQGGNTSLVAGSVPADDEIILCLSKMNAIETFDESTGVLQCQSGCILETLESYVFERGFMMPYDLGAKGSCQIGGNVSTNAGGIRFIKYGSLHGSILGLEAILPNGQILDMMSTLRKDNTGYDLKQLFIGSEGTLGVISRVSILCPIKPSNKMVTFLGVPRFQDIIKIMDIVRKRLSPYLSAFEMMDALSLDAVSNNLGLAIPFTSPFYVLFELSLSDGCNQDHIISQLHSLLENLMEQTIISDGTISTDLTSVNRLWSIRERIAEALLADGFCYKYDVSLEPDYYYDLVEMMRERLRPTSAHRICGYGHIGDNNLHLTITTLSRNDDAELKSLIEPFVFEYIRDRKGSISAEHGLGMKKRNHIYYSKSPQIVELMKQIKSIFDPKGILNPRKMLPDN